MTDQPTQTDIAVRGGQINVPHSTTPRHPNRHQPDTPLNKKFTPDQPKPKKRQPKTKSPPAADTEPPPGETHNEPAPPS